MALSQLNDAFEQERYWLEKQPEMQPWEKGKAELERKLEQKIDSILNGKIVPYRSVLMPRIWTCVVFHWKNAIGVDETTTKTFQRNVPVDEILQSLVEMVAFDPPGKKLGGDPLPDVVYTVFYVKKDDDANQKMNTDYKRYCIGVVKDRDDMRNSFEDWWNLFMIELGGFEYEPNEDHATIYRYSGENHLKSWLSTACYNHARGYLRDKGKYIYPEMDFLETLAIMDEETPEKLAMMMESGYKNDDEYKLNVLDQALKELDEFDQTVLKQKYIDGLTLVEVGDIHYPELEGNSINIGGRIRTIRKRLEANMQRIIQQEKPKNIQGLSHDRG